ncbi:MAG TPA: hypothetical protein VES20_19420 [Bryobacteraceae bacterium]|nr:hypothetical protein [Bryobacteraceae bacterium]
MHPQAPARQTQAAAEWSDAWDGAQDLPDHRNRRDHGHRGRRDLPDRRDVRQDRLGGWGIRAHDHRLADPAQGRPADSAAFRGEAPRELQERDASAVAAGAAELQGLAEQRAALRGARPAGDSAHRDLRAVVHRRRDAERGHPASHPAAEVAAAGERQAWVTAA